MTKKFFGAVFANGTKITRASNGWKDFTHAWKATGASRDLTGFSGSAANAAKTAAYYSAPEVVPALTFATAKEMKAWKAA